MKIAGITAEYNPFHKGHRYHIEKTREALGADCIIAVMSGNFTQRGEAAVMDKWTRSRIATEEGVDLVVELPFLYACNRAEFFAQGAVDILQSLGVSHIWKLCRHLRKIWSGIGKPWRKTGCIS